MKRYKLTEHHELSQKFEKLCELADELGIRINFAHYAIVEYDGMDYELRETDNNEYVSDFPPAFEYKFVYNKED